MARAREVLVSATKMLEADAVLLSGGLDSTIAASLTRAQQPRAYCVTAPGGEDRPYAILAAKTFGLDNSLLETSFEELAKEAPIIARLKRTFDGMEIRNSVVQFIAMREAKRQGARCVLTGDGGDELFAGYSYMTSMPRETLDKYRRHLAAHMSFTSETLAQHLGIKTCSPYLVPAAKTFAISLPSDALVGEHAGRLWGKWILREAFEGDVPDTLLWRWKDPMEVGSGSSRLPEYFSSLISPAELEEERAFLLETDGVRIRDAEHLAFYQMYRRHFPPPRDLDPEHETRCAHCGGPVPPGARFCTTCGGLPHVP